MQPDDDGNERRGERSDAEERLSTTMPAAGARAAEIAELSRRALSAKVDLLTYVDELEDEVRRLRRQLGDAVPYDVTDATA